MQASGDGPFTAPSSKSTAYSRSGVSALESLRAFVHGTDCAAIIRQTPFRPESGDGSVGKACAAVMRKTAPATSAKTRIEAPLIKPADPHYIRLATVFRKEVIQCLIVMTCGP